MSSPPQTPVPSSQFKSILDAALTEYKTKTGNDLADRLSKELQSCYDAEAVLDIIQSHAEAFDKFRNGDNKLMKYIRSSVHVLYTISSTLGEGIGLAHPPAKVVSVGIGVLLAAAKDVQSSHDALVDLFERIQFFLKRLGVHTQITLTDDMVEILVKIVAEVLSILSIATKEMQQSRTKTYLKKLAGMTDIEDALKRLDSLTREEFQMAMVEVRIQVFKSASEHKHDAKKAYGTVQEIARNVDEMMYTMGKIKYHVDEIMWIHIEQDIRKWFSPPDPTVNYNIACEAYHEGTAAWFFEGTIFKEWELIGSLLWIHGKPGSGKSILCTSIIKHLISLRDDGLATLAFFYFDFRDKEKQNVRNFLTSLLSQFSAYSEPCCGIISRLYSTHAKGAQQPSVGVLKNCLKEMLRVVAQQVAQQPVYVILDALDECPDMSGMPTPRETVLGLMEDLVEMQLPSLHLCITSRPEVDIKDALEPLAYCVVSLHDESGQQKDITDYVGDMVYSDKKMRNWRAGEKKLVIEELSKKADGMFRWVFCQLEVLRYCLPASIRQNLDQLPKTLDETYARVLSQIPQANQVHAHRMLQCLMVAVRPLHVEELAELLAFEFDSAQGAVPKYRADWTPHDKVHAVLSTCSSLIAIVEDQGSQVVQFSHFSVKEFLMSNRLGNFFQYQINPGPAHTILAQACLGSLLHLDDHANKVIVKGSPLAEYAAKHWVTHAQFEDVASLVKDGMETLFDCDKPHFAAWVGIYNIDKSPYLESPSKIPTPLYFSSLCGFSDLVEHLAIKHPQHVNAFGGQYEFPLRAALINEHLRVAEILLKHGANVNARGTGERTPLHGAITNVNVVEFLLKYGADVNCQQDDLSTPLHLAMDSKEFEVSRALLEHEADVDSLDEKGKTPLYRLLRDNDSDIDSDGDIDGDGESDSGRDDDGDGDNDDSLDEGDKFLTLARLLLEHGADTNIRVVKDWTLLHMAAFRGRLKIAEVLLDRGANPNVENDQGETPLHVVSRGKRDSQEHVDIARLLLERAADVNARRKCKATPLHLAALKGRSEIAQILLDRGANPGAENDQGETPLHLVSRGEYNSQEAGIGIALLLLEHGLDVNARGKSGVTPLHLAAFKGRSAIAQVLLDRGANPGAENDQGETPLHLVSRGEYDSESRGNGIALLLLGHGLDVNARGKSGATPLHLAAFKGRSEIAQVLLDRGANPGAENDQGETPLHLVSRGEYDSQDDGVVIALLLLGHGVDVNARRKNGATPFHLAAFKGRSKIAQVLLDHGANLDAENDQGETPLHLVSKGEYDSQDDGVVIALLLLEHGVDVNARRKNGATPFHLAAFNGRSEIAQVLLDRGANPGVENDQGETPLHLVSRGEYDSQDDGVVIALRLLGYGVDVNARRKNGATPSHLAAFKGKSEIAQVLLDHGANLDVENDQGETPLHLVSRGEYDSQDDGAVIALQLLGHGIDVHARDNHHDTALHSAAFWGRLGIATVLLDYGANSNVENDQGETPLHLVSQGGYWLQDDGLGVAELLLEHGADINAQDKNHASPLQLACYRGRLDIARVLLDYDAKFQAD